MHTPSNRIKPCGELMPPGLFGSTTIDCSACTEKANTRGTTGATGVVVALESVSENGCQYHCWAAASPHVTKLRNHCLRQPTTLASIWELDRAVGTCHQRGGRQPKASRLRFTPQVAVARETGGAA